MLRGDDLERIALAFGAVGKGAHLSAVKATVGGNPDCSDVFATEEAAPALGWNTNVIVAERSKP